jgi:hypothetical protein
MPADLNLKIRRLNYECRFADRFAANIKTGILAYPDDYRSAVTEPRG